MLFFSCLLSAAAQILSHLTLSHWEHNCQCLKFFSVVLVLLPGNSHLFTLFFFSGFVIIDVVVSAARIKLILMTSPSRTFKSPSVCFFWRWPPPTTKLVVDPSSWITTLLTKQRESESERHRKNTKNHWWKVSAISGERFIVTGRQKNEKAIWGDRSEKWLVPISDCYWRTRESSRRKISAIKKKLQML